MPAHQASYLDRPIRVALNESQRIRLYNAASKALKANLRNTRAMLILRLNQPRVTWEEARAQAQRAERRKRDAKGKDITENKML